MTNQIAFFVQHHNTVLNGKSWPTFLLMSENQRKLALAVHKFEFDKVNYLKP